jgi:hypothetical protein
MSQHNDIRQVVDPIYGPTSANAPVDAGGTASITADDARNVLKLLPTSSIEVDDGVAGLDANKFIYPARFARPVDQAANAQGDLATMDVNTTKTFQITNYDSRTTYVVAGINGVATLSVDTITYTAGSVAGAGGFTINGKLYAITITGPYTVKPSITSPVNASVGLSSSVAITSSAFSTSSGTDTHASSTWQLATDAAFTNIVSSTTADTVNKTSWTVSGLTISTTYYVRMKQIGATYGASVWSDAVSFTTRATFVGTSEIAEFTGVSGHFGYSVAMSTNGLYAVIGNGYDSGNCYVYFYSGGFWSLQATLSGSGTGYSLYGIASAISGDGTYAVFTHYDGTALVFKRTGTTFAYATAIIASDWASGDYFGHSVDITDDGSYIVIGASRNSSNKGSVYVFHKTSETVYASIFKITNPYTDTLNNRGFGGSVAFSSDASYLVVGFDESITTKAAVYVKSGETWVFQTTLTPPGDFTGNTGFGNVSISGDGLRVAVGARHYQSSTVGGSIVVYVRSGTSWSQEARFDNPNPVYDAGFGMDVCISPDGSSLFIGAQYDQKVTSYKRSGSTWSFYKTYVASDNTANSFYGFAADCSGDGSTTIVGAYGARKAYILG